MRQLGEECVEWAVSAVHRCFLYDTLGFMTKERFEAVHTPLVNLIEDSYVRAKLASLGLSSASFCVVSALSLPVLASSVASSLLLRMEL
jgi:hypothetical protein